MRAVCSESQAGRIRRGLRCLAICPTSHRSEIINVMTDNYSQECLVTSSIATVS
jgi:hypothetical protein